MSISSEGEMVESMRVSVFPNKVVVDDLKLVEVAARQIEPFKKYPVYLESKSKNIFAGTIFVLKNKKDVRIMYWQGKLCKN